MGAVTWRQRRFGMTDWDGVFSASMPVVYEANARMGERRGKPRRPLQMWLANSHANVVDAMAHIGVHEDPAKLSAEYASVLDELKLGGFLPTLTPHAREFCRRARRAGIRLIVISSHPQEHLEMEAQAYCVSGFFEKLVGDVADKADAMTRILMESGMQATDAFYLGDTSFDVAAAKAASVPSIAVASGYHLWERLTLAEPDLIVKNLGEAADELGI